MFKKNTLRFQIFLSMTLLVLVAFAILAFVMIGQYKKQALEYHDERLIDKENQIKMQIQYVFSQTTFPVETPYIPLIFREDIYSIANIKPKLCLYDLDGVLLKAPKPLSRPTKMRFSFLLMYCISFLLRSINVLLSTTNLQGVVIKPLTVILPICSSSLSLFSTFLISRTTPSTSAL